MNIVETIMNVVKNDADALRKKIMEKIRNGSAAEIKTVMNIIEIIMKEERNPDSDEYETWDSIYGVALDKFLLKGGKLE
tara:strand:- start:913 stop:1149 length:237 start_codon:yes stop_codon:yes gene_type:complete